MRPLDPRLLRFARSTRGFIALTVVLGVVTAVLVILQARLLSDAIVSVTADGADLADVAEIGRAHVCTPVTSGSRMPSSA